MKSLGSPYILNQSRCEIVQQELGGECLCQVKIAGAGLTFLPFQFGPKSSAGPNSLWGAPTHLGVGWGR